MVAVAVLLSSCSSDPNTRKLSYLHQGEKYAKTGRYQEAVIEFRNSVEIDPRFAQAHYELGHAYLALKKNEQAYHELNEATALDPANSEAQLDLANLLLNRRQLDQAEAIARKIVETDPANVRAHVALGEKFILDRDFPKAIEQFQKVVELEPQVVRNYGSLAPHIVPEASPPKPRMLTGRQFRSIRIGARSRSFEPVPLSAGKLAQAEDEMRLACGLDSRAISPRIFLARIYLAMGRTADAEATYSALKAVAPDNPDAYQALGAFYMSTGQKEKAVAEFQALSKAHPHDTSARNSLAEALLDLNRTADAAP